MHSDILAAVISAATFLAKHWQALLTLQLTQRQKELELVEKTMAIRQNDRMQSLKAADMVCDLYKKLRLPDEQIRDAVEPFIEEAKASLSTVARPARQRQTTFIEVKDKPRLHGEQGE